MNHFLCVLSSYHEEDEGIGISRGKVQGPKFRGQKSKKYACKMSDFIAKGLESIDFTRIYARYLIV